MTKQETIIELIIKELEKRLNIHGIKMNEVTKNNGVHMTGISIPIKESLAATIYIDNGINKIMHAQTNVNDVVDEIIRAWNERDKHAIETVDVNGMLRDKEFILKHVHRILINRHANADRIDTIPHEHFFDLDIVYRAFLDETRSASFLISNDFMKSLGITVEELRDAAIANDHDQYCANPIYDVLKRYKPNLLLDDGIIDPAPMNDMLVCSNDSNMYGASVIADDDYMKFIANLYRRDFFIIPSSIHEVITIPADFATSREVISMVRDVNATQLSADEVLSNSVYKYDFANNEIQMIA